MDNIKTNNIVKKLPYCSTIEEVESIMEGKIFRNCINKFEDNYIHVFSSKERKEKLYIKLKNKVYILLYKVAIFLVYEGYGAEERQGKGRIIFANQLHTVLSYLEKTNPDIKSLEELKRVDYQKLITINSLGIKKEGEVSVSYQYEKLLKLEEIDFRLNSYLPNFLRIYCIDYFDTLQEYKIIKKKANYRNKGLMFGDKVYDIENIRDLTKYSLDYIENNKKDLSFVLEIIELYNIKDMKETRYQKRKRSFDKFKKHKGKFILNELNNIKDSIKNYTSYHKFIEGRNSIAFYTKSKEIINLFEACSLIILLMTTGARKGELLLLKRFPKYKKIGSDTIKKTIVKTSYFENGDEVDMPIIDSAKVAINILSLLGQFYDKSKIGNLLSFYNISKSYMYLVLQRRIDLVVNKCDFKQGSITPHMFRHAIAYLIYSSSKNHRGIDLVKILLGHKDYKMTLNYLGMINKRFKEVVDEYRIRESYDCINEISEKIKEGDEVYGGKGERIKKIRGSFIGEIKQDFHEFFKYSYDLGIKQEKIIVLKTEYNYCIRSLDNIENAACQMGIEFEDDIRLPQSNRCEGANCASALIFASQLDEMDKYQLDSNTLERLLTDKTINRDKLIEFDAFRKYKKLYENDKCNNKIDMEIANNG